MQGFTEVLYHFYKLGALQAYKVAFLGEALTKAPAIAKHFARLKGVGKLKGGMREALGLETPEWRQAGGMYEIPELAAKNITEAVQEALTPEPESVRLPVIKVETKPKKKEILPV